MITTLPAWLVALLLTLFTYFLTTLGSAVVFMFKNVKQSLIDFMLAFSAGIMLASGIFSLLIPSIKYSEQFFGDNVIIPCVSFLIGSLFIIFVDIILDRIIKKKGRQVRA